MDYKCYSLEHLETFMDKIFLYDHVLECKEITFTYERIIGEVKQCLQMFKQYNLDKQVGVAINMMEHSAENCVLLLG